mgnify:FL=1
MKENGRLEKLVKERTNQLNRVNRQLQQEIISRSRVEEALSRELEINLIIAELSGKLLSPAPVDDISLLVLEHAKKLTGSKYGYVGYIEQQTGYFICCTLSRDVWKDCQIENKNVVFERFGDLGGWVIKNRKALLSNSPSKDPRSAGTPPGHIPIERVLLVPALLDGILFGVVALANSSRDYTEQDQALVERLCWLFAIAVRRMRDEEALRISEANYRAIFDAANDAVLVHDMETGLITDVNRKAYEMYGYTPEEFRILGEDARLQSISLYTSEDTFYWLKKAAGGDSQLFECRAKDKNGRVFWVEVNMNRSVIRGKDCIVATIRDITNRRRIEKEMARLDRLNLVGEMAAGIGHEIRNPMTTVRGFLQLLLDKEGCSSYLEYFNLMIEELDRANGIISEYLSLAKNRPVDLRLQNLNTILKTLFPLIQADATVKNKSVKLEMGDVPDLLLDDKEMRQLILNLVCNGLESMHCGGELMIRTFANKGEVILSVKDRGRGIDSTSLDKIGTPFFTTKEQGTGLGLAVCFSIAARHNAAIHFDTGPGGTTFYVVFKCEEAAGTLDSATGAQTQVRFIKERPSKKTAGGRKT